MGGAVRQDRVPAAHRVARLTRISAGAVYIVARDARGLREPLEASEPFRDDRRETGG